MGFSVGQVARLAGVSVRTLHHYDEIGLLCPGRRSTAGYRRYGEPDLERLQQILYYRELGFSLEEIAIILDDPDADAVAHLRRQRELLKHRITRLTAMVTSVTRAMEAELMGISLSPQERFEVFGEHDPAQYAPEAQQRWGDTDAYQQSMRRTRSYTKQDWQKISAASADTEQRLAAVLRSGAPAGSQAAMDLAEEHRLHLDKWFYTCPYQLHRGLAEMYLADPRFAERYDTLAPGLARYLHDAIMANADRHPEG